MAASLPEPSRRVVLLGASNLTRGLHTALTVLRGVDPRPVDVLAALGNGRSYGIYSRVAGRGLVGILDCGLWRDLAARPPLPISALLTDIGNDVMYGVPVPTILEWIETCLRRLQDCGARVAVTGLPTANLPRLGARRFLLLRTLFFPRNRDSLAVVAERSRRVDAGVRELAERYGATWVAPAGDWYGFDPIHFRLRHWPTAWQTFLTGLVDGGSDPETAAQGSAEVLRVSIWNSLRTQFLVPEERRLLGIAQRRRQPCLTEPDGTRVSLY